MLHVKIWFGHFSDVTLTLAKREEIIPVSELMKKRDVS